MPDLTTPEEQERALSTYYRWFTRLQELEALPERDHEWRFAVIAEQAWASAISRSGLPYPVEHLRRRHLL